MKNVLRMMLCLVLLTSVYSNARAAEPYATGSLKEMVYELPSDSGKMYLSVVGDANDGSYKSLCKLFNETPDCQAVRDQYQYTQLTKASKLYQSRYAKDFKAFPTVRIQTADGTPVQEWSGHNIPADGDLIANLKAECFRRHRQQRQSTPDRHDSDKDQSVDQAIDKSPRTEPVGPNSMPPWKWALGAIVVGALIGLGVDIHKGSQEK